MDLRTWTGWSGLSALDVLTQSAAIHPDWMVADHEAYLISEEGFPRGHFEQLARALSTPTFRRRVAAAIADADREER